MKMNLEMEQQLAEQIITLETELLNLLKTYPQFQKQLQTLRRRARKHNADLIDYCAQCIESLKSLPEEKSTYRKAQRLQERTDTIRWGLALSAEHIAKIEANKMRGSSLNNEDLVQEGYIGLLEAAKRYDPTRDIRFTTYARWWVRAQITRYIENTGRLVRIPGGAIEQTRNLQAIIEQYANEGIDVDLATAAADLGISTKRANMLLKQKGSVSLDVEDPEGCSLRETLPSDIDLAEDELEKMEALEIIQNRFSDYLDSREQFILTHHFGLDGHPKQTMREIGEQISLSKERVRQLESKAISRLRTLFN